LPCAAALLVHHAAWRWVSTPWVCRSSSGAARACATTAALGTCQEAVCMSRCRRGWCSGGDAWGACMRRAGGRHQAAHLQARRRVKARPVVEHARPHEQRLPAGKRARLGRQRQHKRPRPMRRVRVQLLEGQVTGLQSLKFKLRFCWFSLPAASRGAAMSACGAPATPPSVRSRRRRRRRLARCDATQAPDGPLNRGRGCALTWRQPST